MKPETKGPWRKTIRREARGVRVGRRSRAPQPSAIRRGSTWMRRHMWMTDRWEIWTERVQ